MSGLVALVGGREHTAACEPVYRRLLKETGSTHPTVAVLLAATVPGRLPAKIDETRRYWSALGARVVFGFDRSDGASQRSMRALADPDLVLLTGGRPWLLHARVTGEVLQRLIALWQAGVPVVGSSAGAMAMCAWRMLIDLRRRPRVVPGFGLVPGAAVAPHYDRHGIRHWSRIAVAGRPDLHVLGLPDHTAVVGSNDHFEVAGSSSCALIQAGVVRRHRPGDQFQLAAPAGRMPAADLAPVG